MSESIVIGLIVAAAVVSHIVTIIAMNIPIGQ